MAKNCPKCGNALKFDGGRMTCPEGHGSFGAGQLQLPILDNKVTIKL